MPYALMLHGLLLVFLAIAQGARADEPLAPDAPFAPDEHTALLLHLDGDLTSAAAPEIRIAPRGDIAWQEGRFGQAMHLDAAAGLQLFDHGSLHVGGSSVTLEAWIRPQRLEGDRITVMSVGYGHGRMVSLDIDAQGRLSMTASASPYDHAAVSSGDRGETLFDGGWHHVAAVLDREQGGQLRLYLDGEPIHATVEMQPSPIGFSQQEFGGTIGALTPWYIPRSTYRGGIDEVRISRVARYHAGAGPAPANPEAPAERPGFTPGGDNSEPLQITADNLVVLVPRFAAHDEYEAAAMLRTWFAAAWGIEAGEIPLRPAHDPGDLGGRAILAIGDRDDLAAIAEAAPPLDPDGFSLTRQGNAIFLRGGSGRALRYGAVALLDRLLGVRFYMPGDLFTSAPRPGPITVSNLAIVSNPYVRVASSTGYVGRDAIVWMSRMALDRRDGSHQHNMWERFPPDRFAAHYPEIYPIIEGKRYIPQSGADQQWQPTFSEPSLVDAAIEAMEHHFSARPNSKIIAFGIQDGHVFSDVDVDHAEVQNHGLTQGLSNLYWRFLNQVAARAEARFPAKKIIGLVYGQVRAAPPFKLHPNVVAWMQWKHSDNAIDNLFTRDAAGILAGSRITDWSRVASQFGHHDWAQGGGFLIPRLYTHQIQRSFQEMEALGAPLRYVHAEAYPNWGLDGPKLYLMARLWWDPQTNTDAVLAQFCEDMFGPAADPMHRYFSTLETLFASMTADLERKLSAYWGQFLLSEAQEAMVRQCRSLLEEAGRQAESDTQRQRIDLFSRSFKLSEMFFALANAPEYDETMAASIRDYAKTVIGPDPMTIYRRPGQAGAVEQLVEAALDQVRGKENYIRRWEARTGQKVGAWRK